MNPKLKLKVMTPRQVLFEGDAYAVSSKNSQGKFDVLPLHANFISLIQDQPIVVTKIDRSKQTFNFHQAIIFLKEDIVTIFGDPTNSTK